MEKHPINPEEAKTFVPFFKALSNEERFQILRLLQTGGELSAQAIEKHFFMEQSTTSHHLGILRKAGLVHTRKNGRNIYYSITPETLIKTCSQAIELFSLTSLKD